MHKLFPIFPFILVWLFLITGMAFSFTALAKTLDIIIGGDMGTGLQCKSDSDCPDGEFCHEEQYFCVTCQVPPYEWTGTECKCPAGTVEKDGKTCVECLTDTDCAADYYCDTDTNLCHLCKLPKIWKDNMCMCPAGTSEQSGICVCTQANTELNDTTGICVCTLTEEDCANSNLNSAECDCCPDSEPVYIDKQCHSCASVYPDRPIWDSAKKECVQCLSNADCTGGTPICDINEHKCVSCPEDKPIWNESTKQCVECLIDNDCPDGEICDTALYECKPMTCEALGYNKRGFYCDTVNFNSEGKWSPWMWLDFQYNTARQNHTDVHGCRNSSLILPRDFSGRVTMEGCRIATITIDGQEYRPNGSIYQMDLKKGKHTVNFYYPQNKGAEYCYLNFHHQLDAEICFAYIDDCPSGYYCPVLSAQPIICPKGSYCPKNAREAYKCPNGTYADTEGKTACTACPAGNYCPAGAVKPTACPTGTYRPITGASRVEDCGQCPGGNYCPDKITPIICPAGNYCPAGATSPTKCSLGTVRLQQGAYHVTHCLSCPAGYYCPNTTTQTICPVGSYCPAGSTRALTCSLGYYCPQGSVLQRRCPAGYYCPYGTGQMLGCPANGYCPEGSHAPRPKPVTPDNVGAN